MRRRITIRLTPRRRAASEAAQGRHPWRPAHVHFIVRAAGCRPLVTHIFAEGDEYLESDAAFGMKTSLVRRYEERPPGVAPDGTMRSEAYVHLRADFVPRKP